MTKVSNVYFGLSREGSTSMGVGRMLRVELPLVR